MKLINPFGRILGGPEPVYLACCCSRGEGLYQAAKDASGGDSCGWCGCQCSHGSENYSANSQASENADRKSKI